MKQYQLLPVQLAPGAVVFPGAVDDFRPENGCNIINTGAIFTSAGTVVINTGPSLRYGQAQRALLERLGHRPITRVFNLNLHPDYFLGNGAYTDVPIAALPNAIAGMRAKGQGFVDNLYRLCGDWIEGTRPHPATETVEPGTFSLAEHRLELLRFHGHTDDDLVIIDHTANVVFAGGLIFKDRAPTTPHADLARWKESLQKLGERIAAMTNPIVIPSHGPVHRGLVGLAQTRDWIGWLDETLSAAARAGRTAAELLLQPIPEPFRHWAAMPQEYQRSIMHLYRRYEEAILQ